MYIINKHGLEQSYAYDNNEMKNNSPTEILQKMFIDIAEIILKSLSIFSFLWCGMYLNRFCYLLYASGFLWHVEFSFRQFGNSKTEVEKVEKYQLLF